MVLKTFVKFTTPFNGAFTFKLGTPATIDRFVEDVDTDPSTTNNYEIPAIDSISASNSVLYNPYPGGATTQGAGFIIVLIHRFYS